MISRRLVAELPSSAGQSSRRWLTFRPTPKTSCRTVSASPLVSVSMPPSFLPS